MCKNEGEALYNLIKNREYAANVAGDAYKKVRKEFSLEKMLKLTNVAYKIIS